jgi:glycosyltransferase involved in cell wall biosynthesis
MEEIIDISLVVPTRGRPKLLERLFDSVADTTSRLERIEIVLYIDEDDLPTQEVSHPLLQLIKLIKPAGEKMGRMNQMCYEASRGRFLMLMNDDVVFRTKGWDARVLDAFTLFPDDAALVYGNDLHRQKSLATLPIVSRAVCDVLGGICPRDYLNVYIDIHLFDVFKKLAKLGYHRTAYLNDVIFEHMHHEVGKSSMDATYVKKNEQFDDLLFINLEDERWNQAKMLKRYINTISKKRQVASGNGIGERQYDHKRGGVNIYVKRMLSAASIKIRKLL